MGLYDSYRLANSTAIPLFAGSVLPELGAAKQDLDQKYDVAKAYAENTGTALDTTPYFRNSQKEFQGVYTDIKDRLNAISARKDYENMVPLTQDLSKEAAIKLMPFKAEQERYQAAVKSLDSKELGLDETTKALLIRKAVQDDADARKAGVGGLYKDPVTGEMKGGFQDIYAAKNIDLPKWVDERLKDATVKKYGSENVSYGNGTYMVKRGGKWEQLGDKEIQSILSNAYSLSPDVQAHVQQQATLNGWAAGQKAKPFYNNLPAGTIKDSIDGLVAKGLPLKNAVQATITKQKETDILNEVKGYGAQKYHVNNSSSTMDVNVDSAALQKQQFAHEDATTAGNALITPGMTVQVGEWAKTPEGLNKGLIDISAKVADLETQKKITMQQATTKDPTARGIANMRLKGINDDLERQKIAQSQYTAVQKSSFDAATQKLGYGKSYDEVVAKTKPEMVKDVAKAMGAQSIKTRNGQEITAAEISDAILNNQYSVNYATGQGMSGNKGLTLNIAGKGQITIPSSSGIHAGAGMVYENPLDGVLHNFIVNADSRINKIQKQAATDYKTPQNLVVPGVTMSDKQITEVRKALPTTTAYTSDGAQKVEPEADVFKDAVKTEVGSVLQTGFVPVTYIDAKGNRTTLLHDFRHTGLRDNVGAHLFEDNTSNPAMQQTGRDLVENSAVNEFIKAVPPGLPVSKAGGRSKLEIITDKGLQQVQFLHYDNQYAILDMDGNIVKDAEGHELQSSDPNQIAPYFGDAINLKDAEMPHAARKVPKK